MGGRKVLADVALSQDDARALALNRGVLGKSGADRRNLYLVTTPPPPCATPPHLNHGLFLFWWLWCDCILWQCVDIQDTAPSSADPQSF